MNVFVLAINRLTTFMFFLLFFGLKCASCFQQYGSSDNQAMCEFASSLSPLPSKITGWKCNSNAYPLLPLCNNSISFWTGVKCSLNRVTQISMVNYGVHGTIPTSIGSLQQLTYFSFLQSNSLTGRIPSALGFLTNLQYFNVWGNSLTGEIPSSIGLISSLTYIEMGYNQLSGSIPTTIGYLTKLTFINLRFNSLTGALPSSLGYLLNMLQIRIYNNFVSGTIPTSIGLLTKMNLLYLFNNCLSGSLPSTLGLLSSLVNSGFYGNTHTGTLPSSLGLLTNMIGLFVESNSLSGSIPDAIWRLTKLQTLKYSSNMFTGTIPNTVGSLRKLQFLDMSSNYFAGTIPSSLCILRTSLQFADFSANRITGTIPSCIGNVTAMLLFGASDNQLTGTLPTALFGLRSLETVYLSSNRLSGQIPSTIGYLCSLQVLDLRSNLLTGTLPLSFRALRSLSELYLRDNALSGPIGNVFDTTRALAFKNVDVSNNLLTGELPIQLFVNASYTLSVFVATVNCLRVLIPDEVCLAVNLNVLVLDGISSAVKCRTLFFEATDSKSYSLAHSVKKGIPPCLLTLRQLTTLHLSGNDLTGTIPAYSTLGENLTDLTLSYNRLSGTIPIVIQQRPWETLALGFNMLSGTLYSNMSVGVEEHFSAEVNRLSGLIPPPVRKLKHVNILEGNIFECNYYDDSLLPAADPSIKNYKCGSDALQVSIFVWLGVAALFFAYLLINFRGSFSVPNTFRSVVTFLFYDDGSDFCMVVSKLRLLCTLIAAYALLVLMPAYGGLSTHYSTHRYPYALSVSIAYLAGDFSASVLVTLLAVLLAAYLLGSSFAPISTHMPSSESTSAIGSDQGKGHSKAEASAKDKGVLVLLVLFDVAVVFAANAGFVYSTLSASTAVLLTLQLILGVAKSVWRNYFIKNIFYYRKLLRCQGDVHGDVQHYGQEVAFYSLILIVNNIVIPSLAEAAIDSSCVYNILVLASPVTVRYSYEYCSSYLVRTSPLTIYCGGISLRSTVVSYVPPFTYRYGCTSAIISNYSSVFVYMFTLTAFSGPVASFLAYIRSSYPVESLVFQLISAVLPDECQVTPCFSVSYYIADMISCLAILLTFGLAFPPLAFFICFAFWIHSAYTFHHLQTYCPNATQTSPSVGAELTSALAPLSSLFFCFFLYDTIGLRPTLYESLWAPAIFVGIVVIVWFICRIILLLRDSRRVSTEKEKCSSNNNRDCAVVHPLEETDDGNNVVADNCKEIQIHTLRIMDSKAPLDDRRDDAVMPFEEKTL